MEEMAAIDSDDFERKHEPLPTNLVLLVIILVLFHVGAIVSGDLWLCTACCHVLQWVGWGGGGWGVG